MKITIKKFIIFFIFPMDVNPILIFIFLINKYFPILLKFFQFLLFFKKYLIFFKNSIFLFRIFEK